MFTIERSNKIKSAQFVKIILVVVVVVVVVVVAVAVVVVAAATVFVIITSFHRTCISGSAFARALISSGSVGCSVIAVKHALLPSVASWK